MTGQVYQGYTGKRYSASKKIGQGGEGAVFAIEEEAALVIKIYSETLDHDKSEKLVFMSSIINDELSKFAAWPLDVARDRSGRVCGFVMRKLESYVPLHNLFSPMDRKKLFPDKGYNFLVHVSRNLAAAFHKIHQLGIVIGDVNEANIVVNAEGMVALIDCDSFQIKNGNKYHFCEVGIPRYTPPELLIKGSFDRVIRTINTDNFSLATLIFQLLFLGRSPFTGINPGHQELDEETAIKTHEFAYSLKRRHKKLFPAKNSLELNTMPSGVAALFHASFETILERPSAAMWVNELSGLNKAIVQCTKTKIHYYPDVIGYCPWCQFRDKYNILYFLDDSYLKSVPEFKDIDQFINGFKVDKIDLKILTESYAKPNITALPISRKFHNWKIVNMALMVLIVAITIGLCFILNWLCLFGGWIAVMIFSAVSPAKKKIDNELSIRQNALGSLQLSLQNLIKQHNAPAELGRYNQSAHKLKTLIESFKGLSAEFETDKKKIQENHYNKKFNHYLEQFDVRNHSIHTFGVSKKNLIYTNGIRTAADVSKLRRIKITGIGPANIQILFHWQRQIGTGFTYIPDINIINQEISVAAKAIAKKRQRLEGEIKSEYKVCSLLKANILALTSNIEQQYNELVIKVHQAQLDLDAFKKFKGKNL